MINICIHGHFYQPPRENPWTGEIEEQPSAAPFHDWNERIYTECYLPNSEAIISDDQGNFVAKINNYELINFNFGPTLLAWIKNKHPETYKKIIEADKNSVEKHNGHGNAIAMCYNHMIMPLANQHDKLTQVKWGLADFKYHFGRDSGGIWLPETACNWDTIEVLINEGIKYIILDTSQATSVRSMNSGEWTDVSNNTINPKQPYRCFSQSDKTKYIDIFFYDGPVSKSVAFDDVLVSSNKLLAKIFTAASPDLDVSQLVSIATDGETFGHHKKFGERTLAFFLVSLAPESNLKNVNYAEYLGANTPAHEVLIKTGDNGEGTSWSCPHGVKRWKEDCGCGAVKGWNQKWRKPLRDSLDWLRDQMIIIYENKGKNYFNDVWKARNDYINLVLDKTKEKEMEFFAENASRQLSNEDINMCYKLLEMQKNAMLMYTSCGWFFAEISGIETVKILEYAAKAIELAKEITNVSLENEFSKLLSDAKSNLPEYANGKNIYEHLVKADDTPSEFL